ncbi:hypothetical protein BCR34DRAFT_642332, partial [Clohesyomyces aquaticus]
VSSVESGHQYFGLGLRSGCLAGSPQPDALPTTTMTLLRGHEPAGWMLESWMLMPSADDGCRCAAIEMQQHNGIIRIADGSSARARLPGTTPKRQLLVRVLSPPRSRGFRVREEEPEKAKPCRRCRRQAVLCQSLPLGAPRGQLRLQIAQEHAPKQGMPHGPSMLVHGAARCKVGPLLHTWGVQGKRGIESKPMSGKAFRTWPPSSSSGFPSSTGLRTSFGAASARQKRERARASVRLACCWRSHRQPGRRRTRHLCKLPQQRPREHKTGIIMAARPVGSA